ncbi:hypothetical protein E2493_03605 [Sphingomonas parva]|uniref:Uncharacterized protein n=1 Tax=Sphingomonas parva TaxID=2555898 RepID=A0A4Y8ZUW4_9SPHN|nr:hypothetical protein [Sphingomonas parva]TFI59704.1 hypothetical protein E2493_03605 [Sphingomonas parva]
MNEVLTMAVFASFALLGLGLTLLAGLRAWSGWLELKRLELGGAAQARGESSGMAELIEMADLKERIRKLESIAACVDL